MKLLNLINPNYYFNQIIQRKINIALYDQKESLAKNEIEQKHTIFQSAYPTGKLFLTISNEWVPVMLVEIIDYHIQGRSIIPIIRDINSGESYMGFCKLLPYSEGLLAIVKPLNPFERYSIVTGHDITDKAHREDVTGVKNEPSLETLTSIAKKWKI